ncbi:hypothetical protein EDF68_11824 [Ochrobactrum sp. BH3]|nr:hypothetical protein EDF68_11824 [Ochrobactrum sp. BH3]
MFPFSTGDCSSPSSRHARATPTSKDGRIGNWAEYLLAAHLFDVESRTRTHQSLQFASQNLSVSISAFSRKQTFHIAARQGRDIGFDRRITFAFLDVNVSAGWVFYFVSYHPGGMLEHFAQQCEMDLRHRPLWANPDSAQARCPTYRPTAAGTAKPF